MSEEKAAVLAALEKLAEQIEYDCPSGGMTDAYEKLKAAIEAEWAARG